jgi:hypothetical protein
MVDTTPAVVCEDPVIFIMKTATNMTAYKTASHYTEQYKQWTPIMPEILSKDVTRPQYMSPNNYCSFEPKQDLDEVIKQYQMKEGYAREKSIINNGQYLPR